VVLWGGQYTDYENFNPIVTRPITDVALPEPSMDIGSWFPAKLWAVNRFGKTDPTDDDRLVIVAGQFKKNADDSLGTERIFTQMGVRIYYSQDEKDYQAPIIWDSNALRYEDYTVVQVDVEDPSGIQTVIASYVPFGTTIVRSIELEPYETDNWGNGTWQGVIPEVTDVRFYVQAVDQPGNTQMSSNKGLFLAPDDASIIYLPVIMK